MDRAVLNAYGWTDIQTTCDFLLDYEDEEDEGIARLAERKNRGGIAGPTKSAMKFSRDCSS